ncbi:MAG: Asp-tRNA(Asn)/Glu-tRNA(Gln) amidotransferase subunit GatB [Patescibacteria group bacterium]
MTDYLTTIGLEVHAELNTKTKMFCDCANDPLEKTPNLNVCPICMGHPGTLPVINRGAVEKLIAAGLALECSIEKHSFFERKNYFYPDLPKGYQISQFQVPFCREGVLNVGGKKIRIERIHLEEDAGKLIHESGDVTLVDYNRAGVPLMELVTHPDLTEPEEVRRFASELQLILRYLGASDADMEKGQMRIEVNLSLRPKGQKDYGTKVEVKNINSISSAAKSADYEIKRQAEVLESGGTLVQETRGWDDVHDKTISQRTKEGSADYRYFPEPDLPPIVFTDTEIEAIRASLPELPVARRERFAREYGLPDGDVEILTVFKELGDFFEEVVSELKAEDSPVTGEATDYGKLTKVAANWLITQLQPKLNAVSAIPQDTKITPALFADFVVRVASGQIGSTAAQVVLQTMWETGEDPEDIIKAKDLAQVSDSVSMNIFVEDAIAQSEKIVADFKGGKEVALKALVGKVMALSKGKADPKVAEQMLREKLSL